MGWSSRFSVPNAKGVAKRIKSADRIKSTKPSLDGPQNPVIQRDLKACKKIKETNQVSLGRFTTTSTTALFFAIMFAGKIPRQLTFG